MSNSRPTHRTETGTQDVNKDDDEELFEWVKKQKTILALYFQNKPISLSIEQVKKLTSLGFSQVRPGIIRASGIVDSVYVESKWNTKLGELKAHKERNNGSMTFHHNSSSLPQPERSLKHWVVEQRREYKRLRLGQPSTLTAERLQKLNDVGLDLEPTAKQEKHPWENRIQQLTSFVEEHNHCKIPISHPELGIFVSRMRNQYREREKGKKNALSDERMSQLVSLGFVFQAGKRPNFTSTTKKSWDERFDELLDFTEEHGHTIVPQLSGPLGGWVKEQRTAYRKFKAAEKSSMSAEKALKLPEIGFVFDASDRWKR